MLGKGRVRESGGCQKERDVREEKPPRERRKVHQGRKGVPERRACQGCVKTRRGGGGVGEMSPLLLLRWPVGGRQWERETPKKILQSVKREQREGEGK